MRIDRWLRIKIDKCLRGNAEVSTIDLDDWTELQEHPRMYNHLRRVTKDARRWKVISLILFFTGIGIGCLICWLMDIFL